MCLQYYRQQGRLQHGIITAVVAGAARVLGSRCTWLGTEKGTVWHWHCLLTNAGRTVLFTN